MRWLFVCRWFREFYSILFTCLPVSPCGDYLPARYGSYKMWWLFTCRIWIAWVFWSCQIDVDNPYVLVVEIEICNKIRCRSMQKNKFEMKVFWGGLVWSFICVASYSFASDLGVNFKFGLAVALVLIGFLCLLRCHRRRCRTSLRLRWSRPRRRPSSDAADPAILLACVRVFPYPLDVLCSLCSVPCTSRLLGVVHLCLQPYTRLIWTFVRL